MYIQLEAKSCVFGGEMGHPALPPVRTIVLVLILGALSLCCGSNKQKPDSVAAADGRGCPDLRGEPLEEVGHDRSAEVLDAGGLDKPRMDLQETTCDLCESGQVKCVGEHSYRTCELDADGCWVWSDMVECVGEFHVCACTLVDTETCHVMSDDNYCICVPQCEGKVCGSDGCGGECPPGCEPGCDCSPDGSFCLGDCGCNCSEMLPCLLGETICNGSKVQHCVDLWADDGICEGECWSFGEAQDCPEPGQVCTDDKCGCDMAQCQDGVCYDGTCQKGLGCEESVQPGCKGCECEECVCNMDPPCCLFGWGDNCVQKCVEFCGGCPALEGCGDGQCDPADYETCAVCPQDCACLEEQACHQAECCTPDCDGKECGDDLCGGSCGQCTPGFTCQGGQCFEYGGPSACEGYQQPSSIDCGNVTYHGCCDEYGRAVWCNGGDLYCVDCAAGETECGWNPAWEVYQCGGEAPAGPDEFPKACSW